MRLENWLLSALFMWQQLLCCIRWYSQTSLIVSHSAGLVFLGYIGVLLGCVGITGYKSSVCATYSGGLVGETDSSIVKCLPQLIEHIPPDT